MSKILKEIQSIDQDPVKPTHEPHAAPRRSLSSKSLFFLKRWKVLGFILIVLAAGVTLWLQFKKGANSNPPPTAQSQSPGQVQALNEFATLKTENQRGLQLFYNGNLEEAIRHFEELLTRTPDQASLTINLASVFAKKGDLQKAEELLEKVIEKNPAHATALNNLAAIKRKREDFKSAEEYYRRGALIADHDPKIDLNLATLLEQNRLWSEAIASYKAYLARTNSTEDSQTKKKIERRIRMINSLHRSELRETPP